jgi:probable phosphoglycerate mutase
VLTSPLARAPNTATLAGYPGHRPIPTFGNGTTGPTKAADRRDPCRDAGLDDLDGTVAGRRDRRGVGARADRVIGRCLDPRVAGDTLLFAHGHLLRVLTARWLGLPPDAGRLFALGTGTVGVLGWDRSNRVIETWNETCHLVP